MSGNKDGLKLNSSATAETCREFCGMRALFDGDYRHASTACTDRQRQARTGHVHKQYAAKDYDAARTALCSPLTSCDPFMDWTERDKACSDLAVTEYHHDDTTQFLTVLSETTAITVQKDASLILPLCDADNDASTSKVILYNQKLCQSPGRY